MQLSNKATAASWPHTHPHDQTSPSPNIMWQTKYRTEDEDTEWQSNHFWGNGSPKCFCLAKRNVEHKNCISISSKSIWYLQPKKENKSQANKLSAGDVEAYWHSFRLFCKQRRNTLRKARGERRREKRAGGNPTGSDVSAVS